MIVWFLVLRIMEGFTPAISLKTREKCAESENPELTAASVKDIPKAILLAVKNIRCQSLYRLMGTPVTCLNSWLKRGTDKFKSLAILSTALFSNALSFIIAIALVTRRSAKA